MYITELANIGCKIFLRVLNINIIINSKIRRCVSSYLMVYDDMTNDHIHRACGETNNGAQRSNKNSLQEGKVGKLFVYKAFYYVE